MKIGVAKEIREGEKRVALVPESIGKLIKVGFSITVEKGAGLASGFSDEVYKKAGAEIADAQTVYSGADILLKVQPPEVHPSGKHELEMMKKSALYAGIIFPLVNTATVQKAVDVGVDLFAMDAIPRITKAQRMDILSSQTNLAGYRAVILGAMHAQKVFPLMMTAAGTVKPGKVVILGAGVAGLQALATAKRLGALVDVSDVRPAVKEQVESLGGKFIDLPESENLEGEGGYAREASDDFLKRQKEILMSHLREADLVVTTAQIPGKKAPELINAEMTAEMKRGAVIVDMAAETGGNCALTRAGEVVEDNGVTVIGPTDLISQVAHDASQLYSRNVQSFLEYFTKDSQFNVSIEDEIGQGALIVKDGQVVQEATASAMANK